MADFTSGFWNWYIFILVVLSFAFCFALIIWMQTGKKPTKVGVHGSRLVSDSEGSLIRPTELLRPRRARSLGMT